MCISDTFIFENFAIKNTDLFANNIISKLFILFPLNTFIL